MKIFTVLILCVSASLSCVADEPIPVQINRYVEKSFPVSLEQQNPLAEVVDVVLPKNLVLVGHAIEYFLQNSGYSVEKSKDLEYGDQYIVFSQLIPNAHRMFNNMRIEDVLQTLIGEAFLLEVNPITRKIGFRLKEGYQRYLPGDVLSFSSEWKYAEPHNGRPDVDDKLLLPTAVAFPRMDPVQATESDAAKEYGPIAPGETISQIVKALDLDSSLYFKAMYAIYQQNPDAFVGNLNLIKQGHRLLVPSSDAIENVDSGVAVDFFNEQKFSYQQK